MLTIFLLFRGKEEVIIVKANKRITGMQVALREFLQFLGCGSTGSPWFRFQLGDYWSSKLVSIHGALWEPFPVQALHC
jgi:hypothetical protein